MTDLAQHCKQLGVRYYQATHAEDILLLKWWMELHESGDIDKLFTQSTHRLAAFLAIFQHPTALIYATDADRITIAAWFTPFDLSNDCTYMGAWTTQSLRGTKLHGIVMCAIYELAFTIRTTIIGITKQRALLPIHRKIGYNILGCIPKAFGGEDGYLVVLTKEAFESGHLMQFSHRYDVSA